MITIDGFTTSRELNCNVTLRASSTLSPGSDFTTKIWMNWDQTKAEDNAVSTSHIYEEALAISVADVKLSLQLDSGLETFYTCGPPYLGINIILDFPKSDLSELEVELRWPLGSTSPDTEILAIYTSNDEIGDVAEASGVNAGALTASQETGDLTGGVFKLTNIEATGQSSASYEDIIIRTHLQVTDEFNPLNFGSMVTITATLTHPASSGATVISKSFTEKISFEILGPQVDQRWECDQFVNGGKTVYCYVWVANRYNATNAAKNIKLIVADVNGEVELKEDEIEISEEWSVAGADSIPTTLNTAYTGDIGTSGMDILSSLSVDHQVLIKIPIVIGTATVGPIDAAKMTIKYENDYTADPCTKDLGETQLDFIMMIPTFPMEEDELEDYFPQNIVIGENITVTFPMQIPQGVVDMKVILTADAAGTANTTYDRHTRDTEPDQTYWTALELLSVNVTSEYDFTQEHRPHVDSGWGFTFPEFTNAIHQTSTNMDVVNFAVNFRMNNMDFLDAGDIVNLTWSFDVNEYTYTRVFAVVVGEPDIGFQFQTYEDGGRIYWTVNAVQEPGVSRSNAYMVTYTVLFNDDIPVVDDSYTTANFSTTMVDGDTVDRYLWYTDDLNVSDTFQFGFTSYLDDSGELGVRAEYSALPDTYDDRRTYTTTYYYPVALHQTWSARNLRLILAATACFFIGVLCAMLVMLVCCKRTTVLPLPTKFELYSRRPAIRLESWIRDRGDMLLTAELADDLVQALTERDYKSSLVYLDKLDIAHTVEVEEELARQQRQIIMESVGWLITVSDLQDEGKALFQQLDREYQAESVELTDKYIVEEKELEMELQKKAKVEQEKLIDEQDADLDGLVTVLQMVPFQDRVDYIDLMKKQHDLQRGDFEVVLRFQLEEAREQLRRDYTIRDIGTSGMDILSSLSVDHQVLIKIPIVIGTATVGPIDAAKMTIKYENDYTADPCTKDLGETQLDFIMMIPTFPMEEDELEDYFPQNIVIGENITVTFPMQIPQGVVDMKVILTADAAGTANTTYDRHTRDTEPDQTYWTALELLSVNVTSEYDFTQEHRPHVDSGWGFTFPEFTNAIHQTSTNMDVVNFAVNFRMNNMDFLDAGDIVNLTWSFDVNEYTYTRVFAVVVGEPDIGFQFQTYEDGGRIYWTVNAVQEPGVSRSNAYMVTYTVLFNDDIPVVDDSYTTANFSTTMVDGDTVDRYLWYTDDLNVSDTFQFGFTSYLDDSGELGVRAEYSALPDTYDDRRTYTTTYYYPVALHQTWSARNLRLILAATACFFIGVLCAMLVMLVCCKRTTVLPLPTKFELYSRRPAIRLESWIRDRGDMLLTAELADDLVQALTERDYKSSLVYLDKLDIAHTVEVEEELARQQRQIIMESVGWLITVSDLQDEGKALFQQLDREYQAESVELTDKYIVEEKELEMELQKKAKVEQEKLIDEQDADLDGLVTVLQMVPFQDRVDYIDLMKKQHDLQRGDFEVVLRFQLEEAREQLRRDYTIRRRVALNVLIREFFNNLAEKANLSEEVTEDLVNRSKHYIEVIDEAFHEEVCRQKFVLEERLLKREAILRIKEERTKYHNNLMSSVSNSMKQTINRLIRESLIKRSYGEDLLSQINIASNENLATMMTVMKNYEESVRDTVRNKAQEKAKKQLNSHLEAYEMFQQKFNAKIARKEVSPAEFLERKIRFHIGRRMEEEQLVDEMDDLISQELAMIWEHYTSESLTRFRETQDKIFETLIKKAIIGGSQTEVQRQRNFRDQSKLEAEKNTAIKMIEDALKQRISESEERITSQIEAEKVEESAIKEQEARMVERLLENQLVMDQETRAKVMREHKRNLLELEEGLTVQKLRYKQKKMSLQLDKVKERLCKINSAQDKERHMYKAGDGRTDETIQSILIRHQDDRTALIRSEQVLTINEVEAIHDEILEEKSLVLSDQKRRLASMLACLQVEKSREVATLRGQLNSLTKVELNLIDDLTNRKVLKEEDVKTMIDTHIESIEGQIVSLNEQKDRQKGTLVKRMDEKLRAHEEELIARHQQQAEEITEKSEKSPAYMYKKMLLLQKHKNERKQLRDNIRIESEQSVEELERKFELNRLKVIKKKELMFISLLVSKADFDKDELSDVFKAMFVTSIEGQIVSLNEQKDRQKGTLVKRMDEKLRAHEEELIARHQQQAEEITEKSEKSPAYMYKKMLLLQKHKNERKQLRDNIRIESEQSVEELERKFELNRLKVIKKKELMFISLLVSKADFDKDELSDVFKAMFVTRSKDELDTLLENAKYLTEEQKEKRGPISILSKAKEELVKRQSSQRFQLSAKKSSLMKPKIRPRRSKDASQFFPRSIRTVAQEAMVSGGQAVPVVAPVIQGGGGVQQVQGVPTGAGGPNSPGGGTAAKDDKTAAILYMERIFIGNLDSNVS
eukprot:sb/3460482/